MAIVALSSWSGWESGRCEVFVVILLGLGPPPMRHCGASDCNYVSHVRLGFAVPHEPGVAQRVAAAFSNVIQSTRSIVLLGEQSSVMVLRDVSRCVCRRIAAPIFHLPAVQPVFSVLCCFRCRCLWDGVLDQHPLHLMSAATHGYRSLGSSYTTPMQVMEPTWTVSVEIDQLWSIDPQRLSWVLPIALLRPGHHHASHRSLADD